MSVEACAARARSALLGAAALLLVAGSTLVAIAYFAPRTHLVLVVTRDGEVAELSPSPLGPAVVERRELAGNETLQLYVEWYLEPRDWEPRVSVATRALVEIRSERVVVLPTSELWDPYEAEAVASHGKRTLAYYAIAIEPEDLRTAFGTKPLPPGRYTLSILFRTRINATDPLGAVHEEDLSLEYRREYELRAAAETVAAEEPTEEVAAGETTVYDISAELRHQLAPAQQARFSFAARREHLMWLGIGTVAASAAMFAAALITPILRAACRVVAR